MPLPITLSPPPSRTAAPATFVVEMDSWLGSDLISMVNQINDLEAEDFVTIQSSRTDTTSNRLMTVGAFGLGNEMIRLESDDDLNDIATSGWYYNASAGNTAGNNYPSVSAGMLEVGYQSDARIWQRFTRYTDGGSGQSPGDVYYRSRGSSGWTEWAKIWTDANTTVDGSGFLLEASPIVRIYTDEISEPAQPVGATLSHPATGHYVLTGVPPLATKGWRAKPAEGTVLGTPRWVGDALHVHVYDQSGAPVDVPEGAFALLRFWSSDDPDEQPPEVESLSAAEGEAALLAERRELRRLTRAEFIVAAMDAGLVSEADAEAAATGAWPAGFDAFLIGLPVADRIAAKAAWVDGGTVRRSHPIIAQIAETMDLSDEALDQLFGIG